MTPGVAQDTIVFRKGDAGEELLTCNADPSGWRKSVPRSPQHHVRRNRHLSPFTNRTSTAVCASDVDLFTLT